MYIDLCVYIGLGSCEYTILSILIQLNVGNFRRPYSTDWSLTLGPWASKQPNVGLSIELVYSPKYRQSLTSIPGVLRLGQVGAEGFGSDMFRLSHWTTDVRFRGFIAGTISKHLVDGRLKCFAFRC